MKLFYNINKNKKAWVAIIEVVIATLVLFTFLALAIQNQNQRLNIQRENSLVFENNFKIIHDFVLNNGSVRNEVINSNLAWLKLVFSEKINPSLNLDLAICNIDEINSCSSSNLPDNQEVAVSELLIANVNSDRPNKLLKIYLWSKLD